jgi:hypothetical protein
MIKRERIGVKMYTYEVTLQNVKDGEIFFTISDASCIKEMVERLEERWPGSKVIECRLYEEEAV